MEPYHTHADPEPIEPGKIYRFDISIEPMAHRFKKGSRVRLEIVNGDSAVTDVLWTHYYTPNKIGTDTIHHSAEHPSALTLPVMEGGDERITNASIGNGRSSAFCRAVNTATSFWPTLFTPGMIATETPETMSPYSIAATPDSSLRKRCICLNIGCLNIGASAKCLFDA